MYKFLSHTADIKFQAKEKTLPSLFKECFKALKETMLKETKINSKEEKIIEVQGNDLEGLLHNFLDEILYLLEAEHFITNEIKKIIINKDGTSLTAEIKGDELKKYKFSNDVKAVTYNDILVEKDKKTKMWKAQIVLDV